ncbi:TetR/AcrR family transcriptional regulator [Nocardia salmonicida]
MRVAKADGLGAVTLRRVATDLGITPSLSSHYFSSVDQLVTSAFRCYSEACVQQLREAMAAVEAPAAKIAQFLRILESPETGGAAMWMDVWRLGRSNEALHAELDRQNTIRLAALTEVLSEGQQAGVFRLTDPALSAFKLLVAVDGLSTQRLTQAAEVATLIEMATTFADAELGLRSPATVAPSAHPCGQRDQI